MATAPCLTDDDEHGMPTRENQETNPPQALWHGGWGQHQGRGAHRSRMMMVVVVLMCTSDEL